MLQQLIILCPYVTGYIFATIVAQCLIGPIMDKLWRSVGSAPDKRPRDWHSKVLGILERAMFLGSFQLKRPEFIGVWLVFKVASQWARWGDDQKGKTDKVHGREFYNIFLIGNALSIVYSAVGAMMIKWLAAGDLLQGLSIPFLVFASTGALLIYVNRQAKKSTIYSD